MRKLRLILAGGGDRWLAGVRRRAGRWHRVRRRCTTACHGWHGSVPSVGEEAQQFNRIGNEVILTKSAKIAKVSVTLVSFACQTGTRNTGDCQSDVRCDVPDPRHLDALQSQHHQPDHGRGDAGLEDPDLHKDVQHQVPAVGGCELRKPEPVQRLGRELPQRSRPEHCLRHPRYETPHRRRLGSHLQHRPPGPEPDRWVGRAARFAERRPHPSVSRQDSTAPTTRSSGTPAPWANPAQIRPTATAAPSSPATSTGTAPATARPTHGQA